MARKSIVKLKGDLRPVYRQLQRLLPRHRACASWDRLAEEMARELHPGSSYVMLASNLQRDLGGERRRDAHFIHPAYFEAFKSLFKLPDLGITDDVLLHSDEDERKVLIEVVIGKRAFDWISVQEQSEDQGRLHLLPSGSRVMGPDSEKFAPLPTDGRLSAPVGHRFRFEVDMPIEGNLTVLSEDPAPVYVDGDRYLPTHCLDKLIGCAGQIFEPGRHVLSGEVRMQPPTGLTRTAMIASPKPFEFPWDTTVLRQLHPSELNRFISGLVARGPEGFRVSTLEYLVVD